MQTIFTIACKTSLWSPAGIRYNFDGFSWHITHFCSLSPVLSKCCDRLLRGCLSLLNTKLLGSFIFVNWLYYCIRGALTDAESHLPHAARPFSCEVRITWPCLQLLYAGCVLSENNIKWPVPTVTSHKYAKILESIPGLETPSQSVLFFSLPSLPPLKMCQRDDRVLIHEEKERGGGGGQEMWVQMPAPWCYSSSVCCYQSQFLIISLGQWPNSLLELDTV